MTRASLQYALALLLALACAITASAQPQRAPLPDTTLVDRLITRAEAALDDLAADASDISIIFGVRSDAAVARTRELAPEALDSAEAAAQALEQSILAIQSHPDYATSDHLQSLRSRLAVEIGETRLPLARARASILLASTEQLVAERRRLAEQAARDLIPRDWRTPELEARRLLLIGAAARIAKIETANRDPWDAAFALIAEADPSRTKIEAVLARAHATAESQSTTAAATFLYESPTARSLISSSLAEPYQRLAAETEAALWRREHDRATSDPSRRRALNASTAALARLLDANDIPAWEARRAFTLDRLRAATRNLDPDFLPPLARAARAELHLAADEPGAALFLLSDVAPPETTRPVTVATPTDIETARTLLRALTADPTTARTPRTLRVAAALATVDIPWSARRPTLEAACALGAAVNPPQGTSARDAWITALRRAALLSENDPSLNT
ncbi:MAG: hypothetical protein VYC34_00425, partial [Planctomycetota bacterium]|nr:hypothetical protein [Planctomycetota bacterium]